MFVEGSGMFVERSDMFGGVGCFLFDGSGVFVKGCGLLLCVVYLCVDSYLVGKRLFWGTDRLFLVERALGLDSHPERLQPPPSQGTRKLTFFFDYSSPWSYIAMERLQGVLDSVRPVQVTVEWVPILLGALFKEIGTPNVSSKIVNQPVNHFININHSVNIISITLSVFYSHNLISVVVMPLKKQNQTKQTATTKQTTNMSVSVQMRLKCEVIEEFVCMRVASHGCYECNQAGVLQARHAGLV